jgi:hypothetical protein
MLLDVKSVEACDNHMAAGRVHMVARVMVRLVRVRGLDGRRRVWPDAARSPMQQKLQLGAARHA